MTDKEMRSQLQQLVEDSPFGYVKKLKANCNKRLLEWIGQQAPLLQDSMFSIPTKAYWVLNSINDFPKCPVCGQPIKANVLNIKAGYVNQTCGKKECRYAKAQQSIAETCIQRYGARSVMQTGTFKEKARTTLKEKYGVEFCSQCVEVQQKAKATRKAKSNGKYESEQTAAKRKKTCLERYGKESYSQTDEWKAKVKSASMKKLGVHHPSQSQHAKDAAKKTCIERYGVEHYASTNECKEKVKKTCVDRYGVPNVWCRDGIGRLKSQHAKLLLYGDMNFNNRAKAQQTCMQRYGVENAMQCNAIAAKARDEQMKAFYYSRLLPHPYVQPLFTADEYIARSKGILLKWRCLSCGAEFESTCSWNFRKDYSIKSIARCPSCFPLHIASSAEEKELAAFIKSITQDEVVENWRGLVESEESRQHSKEIDVYIPSLKLGFEYDGLYWHQHDDRNACQHLHKTQLAEQQGIMLVHVRSDQWLECKDFWKKLIKTMLLDKVEAFKLLYNINQPKLLVDRGIFSKAFQLDGWNIDQEISPTCEAVKWNGKAYCYESCGQLLLVQC